MARFKRDGCVQMIFWRIVDNQIHPIQETDNLGFEEQEGFGDSK